MGTTCVAAVVQGETLSVAHAGDSRAYLLRDGALERLTDDHSYVAEQVRAGVISEESAQRSRFRNVITRAVGIEPTITPDLSQRPVRPGDALLLCTDGLTNMVPEDQIARIMQQAPSAQAAAERLIQIANRNGGKDNITAVVARLEVSNRTQRMLAEELSRLNPRNRTQQMRTQELPAPRPLRTARPRRAGRVSPGRPARASRRPASPRRTFWPILSAVALCALLGVTGYLVHILLDLTATGSRRRVPSSSSPRPCRPCRRTCPASTTRRPPCSTSGPCRAACSRSTRPTARSPSSPRPARSSASPPTARSCSSPRRPPPPRCPPSPADGNQHFAADAAGDLFVADAAARVIYRYPADGGPLGMIPSRWLQHPASLAVASDGIALRH